ncbi:mechanosensitive ion channel family protein [Tenacibaculum sp. IB213877]|uniref:mechanosensitive ion channel family protein n=1 Tax=Tenacibaculum sp. IB213877 TaxID=3097351 RepID=UPI002A599C9B|nr:mechanosensitive ion channel family protein [Tenacibaculum sp. IB213877]MDY0779532.1 mechanosensitive ion channel family protein [Tenacibaculum sp. IB213877]
MTFSDTLIKLKNSIESFWLKIIDQVPEIIVAILIVTIGFLAANFISKVFKKTIASKSKDPLMTNFLTKVVKFGIILLVIMFALKIAGLSGVATGLLTAAGASAVIIGFAFKDIGENFISGVILSFKRPFDLDDTILVDDIFGKVKALEFRYTKLKTFDGRDVYIPNSDIIKKAVYNYTEDGYYRLDFVVGIDYDDDIDLAKKVIINAVVNTVGVINTAEHQCFVTVDSLGVSTVNLKVIFWTKTKEYKRGALETKSDAIKNVKNVIIENGLNMPADIKEIKLYGSQDSIPVTVKTENNKKSS